MTELIISLGNIAPHQADPRNLEAVQVNGPPDPERMMRLDPLVHNVTTVHVPAGTPTATLLLNLTQLWPHHSSNPPSWIVIEGDVPSDKLEVLERQVRYALGMPPRPPGPTMLLTSGGIDFLCTQCSGAASATAVAKYIGLTANSTAPASGDTVLTGEIATAGGGLVRAAGTYAHTNGALTFTLTNTWIANGNDVLPVTIAKVGLFTAASVGTLVFETLMSATATLSAAGDNVPLTWTFTV